MRGMKALLNDERSLLQRSDLRIALPLETRSLRRLLLDELLGLEALENLVGGSVVDGWRKVELAIEETGKYKRQGDEPRRFASSFMVRTPSSQVMAMATVKENVY
jgi:hypothetical protein